MTVGTDSGEPTPQITFQAFLRIVTTVAGAATATAAGYAEWSFPNDYEATVNDVGDGSVEMGYTLGPTHEHEALEKFALDADGARATSGLIELIHGFSRTHFFTGTAVGPDPDVKNMGDAWTYLDSNARKIIAGHYNRHGLAVMSLPETIVFDPDVGADVLRFDDYLRDARPTEQHKEEIRDVGLLLHAAGDLVASMRRDDKPDVHVDRFGDSDLVYVEHARVVLERSAKFDGLLRALSEQLDAAALDPALSQRLRNVILEIGIGYDSVSGRIPSATQLSEQIITFVESTDFDGPAGERATFPEQYGHLHRLKSAFIRRGTDGVGSMQIRRIGAYDDARILADQMRRTLLNKMGKALSYQHRPLWLALHMNDSAGYTAFSLEALRDKAITFAPYDVVIVGNEDELIRFEVMTGSSPVANA